MLVPIQYPEGRYFLNKMPEIVMSAGNGVSMSLWLMQGQMTEVFAGRYLPGFDGKITIDISDIVRDYLKTIMPEGDSDLYQSGFEAHFAFKIDEDFNGGDINGDFIVVNASPSTNMSFEDWCASHFLTDQPIEKPSSYESPEWLTYYDYIGDWIVVGRFYPKEGGAVDMIVKWDEKPGCWSVNVNYARLIPYVNRLPQQLKGFYDIILFDGSMNEFCRQRYLYNERTGREHYYLFANALGGIDTLICQGENVLKPELEHNIGRFGKRYKPLDDTEDMREWVQNTGMMPHRWRNWLYDLLSNKQCAAQYDPKTDTYHSIVLKSTDIGMSDNGQLAKATFEYIMDEAGIVIAEEERSLSQSAADSSSQLDDLTTETVVKLDNSVSDTVKVTSEKVYVSFASKGDFKVIYFIDGTEAGFFNPSENASPVVISLPYGAVLHFETDGDIESLTLNWYEGWMEKIVYDFVWSGTVCATLPDAPVVYTYTYAWSELVCAKETAPYSFSWSENRCVLYAGVWEFQWSEDRCAMEYFYKLVWEEINQEEEEESQN